MPPAQVHHPLFARCWALMSHSLEREFAEHREVLLAGVTGRIVEIGAGNGMNFGHYPATAQEVVALEPEPYLRRLAVRAAASAPVPVRVIDATAESIPSGDGEFDVAVASLVLCSVPEPVAALAEARRVLRPGGELRFLEHVRAQRSGKARLQAAVDRSGIWPRLAGGCHCARSTVEAISSAGLEIESLRTFDLPPSWGLTNPVVLGVARV